MHDLYEFLNCFDYWMKKREEQTPFEKWQAEGDKAFLSPFQKAAAEMAQRTEQPIGKLDLMPVLPAFRPMPQIVNNITVTVNIVTEPKQQPTELPQRDYPCEIPTPGK